MPARNLECNPNLRGSDIIAQQLFLGSSITSFNSNTGWNGSPSTLTVNLVDDNGCDPTSLMFNTNNANSFDIDDHYYNCIGNNCYMDENGNVYDPSVSKEKIVPGKIYHTTLNSGLVSRYWRYADPGFFGQSTVIDPNSDFDLNNALSSGRRYRYKIIGTPAYFRFGYFTFGGIITNWTSQDRMGLPTYTVTLSSAESILRNCKVIVSKYTGSVFAKINSNLGGGPSNYTGTAGIYRGLLKEGNLANVFNVYGFLESYGFGTSNHNDRGIPITHIIDGLSVLTSVAVSNDERYASDLKNLFPGSFGGTNEIINNNRLGYHSAFSPFGRILASCMLTDDLVNPIYFNNPAYAFGVMTPSIDEFNIPRVEFLLDLSEIPRIPLDIRYIGNDGVASISDIITQACEKTGRDWYTTIIRKNGFNFIKVKTVDRTTTLPTNTIESVVKTLELTSPEIPVTTSNFGKEKNLDAVPRVMYIGANQQRLFQTKSYLLGYSNTHLVYSPILNKFVNYYRLCESSTDTNNAASPGLEIDSELELIDQTGSPVGQTRKDRTNQYIKTINQNNKWTNSYRIPISYSTRNLTLSRLLNGSVVTELFGNEQKLAGNQFDQNDDFATDKPIGGSATVKFGNYWTTYTETICKDEWYAGSSGTEKLIPEDCKSQNTSPNTMQNEDVSLDNKPRYIPLKYSSICPFFGYVNDQLVVANDKKGSNIYRFVRPTFLDTWTGLLVVGFSCNELPMLSAGMLPVWYAKHSQAVAAPIGSKEGLGSSAGLSQAPSSNEQSTNIADADREKDPNDETTPPTTSDPLGQENDNTISENEETAEAKKNREEQQEEIEKIKNGNPYNNYDLKNICFFITESEMRAALSGRDDYLAYCLLKMPYSKPHLFTMLVKYYQSIGKLTMPIGNPSSTLKNTSGLGAASTVSQANIGVNSSPSPVGPAKTTAIDALNMNFNWVLTPDFMKDWDRITAFVRRIAEIYYGKQYLIKMPTVLSYRDYQYADLQLPVMADTKTTMSIFQGSSKIFFNYEITDGAWEEFGNYIDDSIIIGSPDYYKLCQEDGKIPAILGYNANPVKDYVADKWCGYSAVTKLDKWKKSNAPEAELFQKLEAEIGRQQGLAGAAENAGIDNTEFTQRIAYLKYQQRKLETTVVGKMLYDCSLNTVSSLDLSETTDAHVLVMGIDEGRQDAFDNQTIGTPITLKDGDKILDPVTGQDIYTVDLNDNPYTKTNESTETISLGTRQGIPTVKIYFPTTCGENNSFIFLDPIGLNDPRALINAPGIDLFFPSLAYQDDPTRTVVANMAAEDYGILENMKRYAVTRDQKLLFLQYIDKITANTKWYMDGDIVEGVDRTCQGYFNLRRILIGLFSVLDEDQFLIMEDNVTNQSTKYYTLAPRKAQPFFAAIPVKDNISCYGPWTNYPILADKRLYPDHSIQARNVLVEQLISNTDVRSNDEWSPWNYGGMSFLDREIINEIDSRATYQLETETGRLTINGMPIFNMAAGLQIKTLDADLYNVYNRMFMYYTYHTLETTTISSYAGLTLSTINTSVSDRLITTSYDFSTYSPRLGIYSKEFSDRNSLASKIRIQFAAEFASKIRDNNNKLTNAFFGLLKNNVSNRSGSIMAGSNTYKGIQKQTSPTQYLVGSASYFIGLAGLPYCGDPGLNSSAYKTLKDKVQPNNLKEEAEYANIIARTKTWVGAFEAAESLSELASQYNTKAFMSLDGIFSPVSFYPTYSLGTYAVSSRCLTTDDKSVGVTCPMCNGQSTYSHYKGSDKKTVTYACPMCSRSKLIVPENKDLNPDDLPLVNFKSLNPIIVPMGEFKNPNSQVDINPYERSRHSIRAIGRQERPIDGYTALDTNHNLNIVTNNIGQTNLDLVENGNTSDSWLNFHNTDYYLYDINYGSASDTKILMNQRFFALRGPMMLHGWGYDTDGYPVPNQADQPKEFDNSGRPIRFILTSSGTNDYTKDGKFLPGPGETLGDIIGSGYVKENGEWVRKPTRFFHLNWGERSDLWPIGPIDLRWDRERKVWTGGEGGCGEIDPPYIVASGNNNAILKQFSDEAKKTNKKCPYKMVYGILEQDIIKMDNSLESLPTRAFLDDLEYGLKPLPQNIRRLIYVIDRTGYSAPRGAKILLRYNIDTGFYEPVSKQQYTVFGVINKNGTASVELSYMPGYKAGSATYKAIISYKNPLNLQIPSVSRIVKGIFMYDNSSWNLISIG